MSYDATDWAMVQSVDDPYERLVLIVLAHHVRRQTDTCWPSVGRIARITRMSDKGVRLVLARLVAKNLVRVSGSTSCRRYHLALSAPVSGTDVAASAPVPGTTAPVSGTGRSGTGYRQSRKEQGTNLSEDDEKQFAGHEGEERGQGLAALGSRLTEDWQPSAADIEWAECNEPTVDWRREADKFRDYWIAKPDLQGGRRTNWPATWRNWLRNAPRRPPGRTGSVTATPTSPAAEPWEARVKTYREKGIWHPSWGEPPGSPTGCRVPAAVLERANFD